jgi:hypothetical protein
MGPLTTDEYNQVLTQSDLYKKYKDSVDPQSAFEMLNERMLELQEEAEEKKAAGRAEAPVRRTTSQRREKSTFEEVISSPVAKQVGREVVRGIFGMLFGSAPRTSRSRRKSIF